MKYRNRIAAGLAITLLLSLASIPQVNASSDEGQMVRETEAATAEFPVEAETPTEAASAEEIPIKEETQEPNVLPNPLLKALGLDTPSSLDENGRIILPEDGSLLDICLPEHLGDQALTAIAPNAFSGTSCLHSIALPASITAIGENAFADCPALEYIVLQGRFDLEGMTLGDNWNGDAEVIFALIVEDAPEETEPAETEPTETEPAETEPAETEPTETEPTETEPAETEPAETEPTETAPAEEETEPSPPVTEPTEEVPTPASENPQTAPSENLTPPEA